MAIEMGQSGVLPMLPKVGRSLTAVRDGTRPIPGRFTPGIHSRSPRHWGVWRFCVVTVCQGVG